MHTQIGAFNRTGKRIFDYDKDPDHATISDVSNISPYLVDASDTVVTSRTSPLGDAPEIAFGSMANDGGYLLLEPQEQKVLLKAEPAAAQFIRPYYGPDEFIKGGKRFCLWLTDATPNQLRALPAVMQRVEKVREERLKSKRPTTVELANTPTVFGEIRQPSRRYLAIPKTSSERRAYIPMAFLKPTDIAGADLFTVPNAQPFHFGVLTSKMHMAWVRYVCGRLKSDYRYSAGIVYNNFPWPSSPIAEQKQRVEAAAKAVLDARAQFPDSTLADLYDPLRTPPVLVKAHAELDRAVDRCDRKEPFPSARARVEYLFQLYEKLTAPLITAAQPKRRGKGLYAQPPPAPSHPDLTPEKSYGDSAHYYSGKEEPPPYRTK